MSPPNARPLPGSSRRGTMASASNLNIRSISLASSSAYMAKTSIPAPVSVWPSASGSWSGIRAGSGSNRSPEKDQSSASPYRNEGTLPAPRHILIVEDNRADVFLIRESIEQARLQIELHVAGDAEQAIGFLQRADRNPSAPCPALVILDINLPKRPGSEVVKHMRQTRCGLAPVLVVTSSDSERDRDEMAKLGVRGYFRKPSDYAEFM